MVKMADAGKWTVKRHSAAAREVAELFRVEEVTAGILLNRGLKNRREIREYLYGGLECLHDPMLLTDMEKACGLIRDHIQAGSKFCIVGDYDIDGIMASYILKRGLLELGIRADVLIPDRVRDGYGINTRLVSEAHDRGADVIITCDNGIAALEAVEAAKELGMTVIVTDHHEVHALPEADAVIDPGRPGDAYPNKALCGAAVAWKLILALGADPGHRLLQYAGFATVGDVMDLTGENRILVKEGLKQLRETDNAGLRTLAGICGVDLRNLNTFHIGFVLGPCLNASGRLHSAMLGLQLLESTGDAGARHIAEELKDLNESRKALTAQAVREAEEQIASAPWRQDPVYVVYMPEIHESIAGIVAGRIRETHNRPAFVLTKSGEEVKGSGRSVEGYDMAAGLVETADLLLKFGGHPMAAGLSLRREQVDEFRRKINACCPLTEEDLVPRVSLDALLPITDITWKLADELSLLEPFGKGNPKPVFGQKYVCCHHPRIFGARHNLLKMRVRPVSNPANADPAAPGFDPAYSGPEVDAICFRDVDALYARIQESPVISIAYEIGIDTYMGERRLQIVITHFQ